MVSTLSGFEISNQRLKRVSEREWESRVIMEFPCSGAHAVFSVCGLDYDRCAEVFKLLSGLNAVWPRYQLP